MTEQEYELLQKKREAIKRYTMERNNQLNKDALHLKREQALNSYRRVNLTKTDEELKINKIVTGADIALKNYDYVTNLHKKPRLSITKSLFFRIKKVIKDNFTFDC